MNRPTTGRSRSRSLPALIVTDVVRAGNLRIRSRLPGIYRTCYVELKSSGALVKYRSQNSTHGRFYDLSRVRLVNYLPLKPTDQQQDFTVEFDNSDMLSCHFMTEVEAMQWLTAIQDLCRDNAPTKLIGSLRVDVDLLPSRSLRFSGKCQLNVTPTSVYLVDVNDPERQPELRLVFWPVESIRHCGFHQTLLMLRTNDSCETKSGEFVFFVHRLFNAADVCRHIFAAITASSDNSAATENNVSPLSLMPGRRPSDPIVRPTAQASSPRSTSLPEILPGTVSLRQPSHAVSCRQPPRSTVVSIPDPRANTLPQPLPTPPSPCPSPRVRSNDDRLLFFRGTDSEGFRIQSPVPSPTEHSPSDRSPTKHFFRMPSYLEVIPEPTDTEAAQADTDKSTTSMVLLDEFSTVPRIPPLGLDLARSALIRLTRGDGATAAADDGDEMGEFPARCGVLLYGPPGCGKQSLSRWFAAECRSRFISVDCRQASSRLSEHLSFALNTARSGAPCVVYLANVDAVSDNEGLEKITTALDAVDCTSKTMLIGASSFPDRVDSSLTTPGRFSEQIYVAPPDESTRQQIISDRLEVLSASKDCSDCIVCRAMAVVNASPAILLSLCDRLNAQLSRRAPSSSASPPAVDGESASGPAVSVRQKLLDDAVADARQQVMTEKDSMEACASKWIERSRKEGWFVVEVDDDRLQNVGVCLLGVDVDAVKMYELNGVEIDSWPISGIRRFWFEPLRLTIETGRSCPKGEGKFTLKVTRAKELVDHMLCVTKRH